MVRAAGCWLACISLAVAPLLGACTGEPRQEPILDLLTLFPYTSSGLAATRIDLGGPDARAHLRSGWSAPIGLPAGGIGALAVAASASLQVVVRTPADARLVVRCGLLGDDPPASVSVRVSLNGDRLGVLHVRGGLRARGGLSEHALRLPARVQRGGLNVLTFTRSSIGEYDRSGQSGRSARARDGRPARPSAKFAVETVAFEGIDTGARARIAGEPGESPLLVLPPSATVDFYLRLSRTGRLTFGTEPDHPNDQALHRGQLRIAMQVEGDRERVLFDGPPPSGGAMIELGDWKQRFGRLTFAATGTSEVRVTAPKVLGVAESCAEPATSAADRAKRPNILQALRAVEPSAGIDTPTARGTERPNVLLYVVDTLRADHLGCYGYPRPTSPRIDRLAAEGVVFSRTIAQSSWTKPATASMLTGRTPSAHGAIDPAAGIRPGAVTLAEVLRQHGYRTAAFVTNVNVRSGLGFERGFEQYVYLAEDRARPTMHMPADELDTQVVRWLDERAAKGPFFVYVHASDPHAPYAASGAAPGRDGAAATRKSLVPRPPTLPPSRDPLTLLRRDPSARTLEHIDYLRALYDREVAFVDGAIGQLMEALRARAVYEDTLVIITSDHGEEFYEHGGFEHGRTLYHEQLAVPLVIRFPGARYAGRRVSSIARQIDILPTLLACLGIPIPAGVQGISLAPALDGEGDADEGDATVEAYSETRLGGGEVVALSLLDWKVIHRLRRDGPTLELYDLDRDPGETTNVAHERPIVLGYAQQTLARWAAAPGADAGVPERGLALDPDTAATLRALGYLDEER